MQNFRKAGIFAFSVMIVMITGSALISAVLSKTGSDSLLLEYGLFYGLQFVLPVLVYLRITKEPARETLRLRLPRPYTFVLAVLFALLIQPALMLISAFSASLFHDYVSESMARYTEQPLWVSLLCVAVLPAFFEEMLARGVFLSGCRDMNIYVACLMCGLFFGVLHLNPQQALYAVVFGALCAFLVTGADSVWPAILAHGIVNGTQIVLAYLLADADAAADAALETVSGQTVTDAGQLVLSFVCLAMAVWCLVRIFYVNRREALLSGKTSGSGAAPLSLSGALPGLVWFAAAVAVFTVISLIAG